jgi:lipid-binding SYLF domain-containing protein
MHRVLLVATLAASTISIGCSTAPRTQADRAVLHREVLATVDRFKQEDPGLAFFFDEAYGYAVFPTVGKGAAGIGGAYGRGELMEDGLPIGFCDLTQATIGIQLGGQAYSEVIFFEYEEALDHFKSGNFAFAAQASAVLATMGASADAKYDRGVAVFTLPKGGLMYEASIGGQKFRYEPKWPR